MSEMLWIAVPGGIKAGNALLRVLIVPRLDGGPLSRHGMAHWPPAELRQGTVRVEVHGPGASLQAPPVLVRDLTPTIPFQSGLWERLVDGLTVENARTLRAAPPGQLTVYPTSQDSQAVARTLKTASQSQVTAELGAQSPDFLTRVRDALLTDHHWTGPDRRVEHQAKPARRPTRSASASPPTDGFHRTLSMLREHTAVLRALGLIFELRLDANPLSALAGGTIRVVWPPRPAPLPTVVSPRTRFGAEFLPGSTPNVDAGMVTLDRLGATGSHRWEVVTVDVDVAAQRIRETAAAIAARPDEPVTMPALRSGGLQLLFHGRGQEMLARLAGATRRQGTQPDILTADDLVLGYRLDVLPQLGGATWYSLQQRRATYRVHRRLAGGGISDDFILVGSQQAPEEGHVKTNAAIHDESGLHADEIMVTWRGWSLAASRPSFEQVQQAEPPARPGMTVTMSFDAAPGTLPGLRFDKHYTLRVRVADIAGGGLDLGDPTPDRYRTPPVFYGRYEPVLAPDVVLSDGADPAVLGPGEAIEHVVVRSDPAAGLDIAQYAARFGYRLDDKRLLLPPPTTQAIAEQHGAFDHAARGQSWAWARRAMEGELPDPAAGGIAVAEARQGAPAVPQMTWDGQWPDLQQRTLHLITRLPGRPQAGWEAGTLAVRLAPAERIMLQLSTFPREGVIGTFALHDANPPGESLEAAKQGRHPMLTPARPVTFVHAVQHPLRAPDTVLTVQRDRGQTLAALMPRSPLLDPPSTAQLDVTVSWRDQEDGVVHVVTDTPVTTLTIDPGGPPQPSTLFSHEFGDTRYRTVTYTLRAISRFRQYFRGSEQGGFARTSTLPPVVVLSSSRPAPPAVLSAQPAFEWKETGNLDTTEAVLTRTRLGTRVRVTLQPPWHSTGSGELLAVVVRPDSGDSGALDDVVSRAGNDPIYPSFGLLGGGPFARNIISGTGERRTLRIEEAAADAVIKPHAPTYHREGRSWLCDVAVTADFDHTFIQLAVARYQPHSLDGRWLSDVVKTDMVPLLPERTMRVTRQPGKFKVELIGAVSSANAVNRVDMILERCRRPAEMPAEQVDLIGFGTAPDDVPVWVRFSDQSPAPSAAGLGPLKKWTSSFVVAPGSGVFRVRVREVELIPNAAEHPGAHLQSGTPGEIKERMVFTDIVPLPVI